jgi:hypothetical protein
VLHNGAKENEMFNLLEALLGDQGGKVESQTTAGGMDVHTNALGESVVRLPGGDIITPGGARITYEQYLEGYNPASLEIYGGAFGTAYTGDE